MESLNELVETKHAIRAELEKDEVEYKGYVFPFIETDLNGGLTVYADAIRNYGDIQGYDFSWIYDEQGCADANYRLYQNIISMRFFFGDYSGSGSDSTLDLYSYPKLNLSKVTNLSSMFYTGTNGNSIAKEAEQPYRVIDASNVYDVGNMFNTGRYGRVNGWDLVTLQNLGKHPNLTGTEALYDVVLTPELFKRIVDNLYDRASAGYSQLRLRIGNPTGMPEEYISIATNKGWIISQIL